MPKLTDENGIIWDIRTTLVTVDPGNPDASWFAAVDDASPRDYSGNKFPLQDSDTFGPPGADPKITWPANGNPVIRGKGNEDDAAATIKLFATRNKGRTDVIALRVSARGDDVGLAILIIAAIIILADKKRR